MTDSGLLDGNSTITPDTIAAEMENIPNPTILDLMGWKYNTGLSFEEVFRIVMVELSDVVKERAKTEYMVGVESFLGVCDDYLMVYSGFTA